MINSSSSLTVGPDGKIVYELEPVSRQERGGSRLSSTSWTLVDTETDGLWAPIHVIEIAAQKFEGLVPVGPPFRVFINHNITIPEQATFVHGYTTEFIRENGIEPKEAYSAFREYVGESYVAAHYLIFDWDRVLVPELLRLKEPLIGSRGFCTWFLSRRSLPEFVTHKLDYLRDVFGLQCSGPHTAHGDVEAVVDLLTRVIFPRLVKAGVEDIISIAEFSSLTPLAKCRKRVEPVAIGVEYKIIDYVSEYQQAKADHEILRKQREAAYKEEARLNEQVQAALDGSTSYPKLLLDYRLLEETPDVTFNGETFLFTGTMAWGSRSKAEKEIVQRGGKMSKAKYITGDIDYLVLGEDPEKGWLSRDSGSKLASAFAMKIKHRDSRLKIIREQDFLAAL